MRLTPLRKQTRWLTFILFSVVNAIFYIDSALNGFDNISIMKVILNILTPYIVKPHGFYHCYGGCYGRGYRWEPNMADIYLMLIGKCNNKIVYALKCVQIQLYWPGLRTNKEFDFGPLALYVQLSTFNLLLIYKKAKTENSTKK